MITVPDNNNNLSSVPTNMVSVSGSDYNSINDESEDNNEDLINKCSFCGENFSFKLPVYLQHLQQLRSPRIEDQFEFCRFHSAQTSIIPEGLSTNYPTEIDFIQLPERVNKLYSELWSIVTKNTESSFRNLAIENHKKKHWENSRSYTILNTLKTLFIDSKKLSSNMTHPLNPLEFLGEVLVPETAVRLIAQDRNITLMEAAEIMKDSIDFGMYVHDMEEDEINNLEDYINRKE
ncbi:8968_t:CDS:2 [Gigaspora rosea]|nr:8968_t:CDS:2 [Gigaspora rosea]